MKRLISLILTFSMLLGILVTGVAFAADKKLPFTDVKDDAWYYSSVKYVYENRIMQGTSSTLFEPELTLSRGMGVTLLYRVDGEPEYTGALVPLFEDVKAGEWYADAVTWAFANNIVKGRTNTEFAPDDDITRAEFAAILSRYAEYADLTLPVKRSGSIADEKEIPEYAREAVKALYEAEVINGREGNIFDPSAQITRAEAAAMIERFVKNAEEKEPEETDPPVTEPEDGFIDIYFFGNSITIQGKLESNFRILGKDKNIRVHDCSDNGWYLRDHVNNLEKWSDFADTIAKEADIIVLQEYGGVYPTVGTDEDLAAIKEGTYGLPSGFCMGTNYVAKLMEILGEDKAYYSYSSSLSFGLMKYDEYEAFDGSICEEQNEALLKIRDIFKEKYNFTHLYVTDLAAFDPEFGFKGRDYTFPDYIHPAPIMGYCASLLLYCEIFGLDPTEQNNGVMTTTNIPSNVEDYDEFMAMVKVAVKEMLDLHHSSEDVDPPATEPEETDPPVTEPEETDPPEADPGEVIDICVFNDEGNGAFSVSKNLSAFETNGSVEIHDYSKYGWCLADYIEWLSENPDVAKRIKEEADIIVLGEFKGGFPTVGEDAEIAAIADHVDTISHIFYKGENVVGQFMEFFGEDKEYYSYSASACGGVMKHDEYVGIGGKLTESQNAALLNIKKILKDKYNITHIFASDVAAFEPELGLSWNFGTYADYTNPLPITGYCTALTVYCSILGKNAVDQNNGALPEGWMEGDSAEEKEAYMLKFKKVVQEIIDVQNGEVPAVPTSGDEPEPPAVERPDDGVIDIYFFGNSITLQGFSAAHFEKFATDKTIKVHDYSSNGASTESHLIWLKKWPDFIDMIAEEADIIVIQEYGSAIPTAYEGGSVVEEFMDLFGRDKEYYVHSGVTVSRYYEYEDENGNFVASRNKQCFNEKKYAEAEFGYKIIYTSDLAAFAPELGLTESDTFPDGIHPSKISGYNAALTLYCTIFGENPSEMNNGNLKDSDIPGTTAEEKDAFMTKLKAVVEELIAIQN